jgi:hypothetical protein
VSAEVVTGSNKNELMLKKSLNSVYSISFWNRFLDSHLTAGSKANGGTQILVVTHRH